MTPEQYRTHKSRALRGAFRSGELVGLSGVDADNPYRHKTSQRAPTRGSWSESCARAWGLGKREGERQRAQLIAVERSRADALADAGGS